MALDSGYFNRKDESVPIPGLESPPSTRPCFALPLVTSIRHQGMEGLRHRLRALLTAVGEALLETFDYLRALARDY